MNSKIFAFIACVLFSCFGLIPMKAENSVQKFKKTTSYHPEVVRSFLWNFDADPSFQNDPSTILVQENFENGANGWEFSNHDVNAWVIGEAVHHGGTKSLYVSKDAGTTHEYDLDVAAVSHAYKNVSIPTDVQELYMKFDWMCHGEGFTGFAWDFLRVWLVPDTYVFPVDDEIREADGLIRVGKPFYNNSTVFLEEYVVIDAAAISGQSMRLVLEWKNDTWGNQPPAAVDNIELGVISCNAPRNVTLVETTQNSLEVSWTSVMSGALDYDLYITTTDVEPTADTLPMFTVTGNNYVFENLVPGTRYYIWVRTDCGAGTGKSFWSKKIAYTLQLPQEIPFQEDFEGAEDWGFVDAGINQWVIGNAVRYSGDSALYISNDQGASHIYDATKAGILHAYREVSIPEGVTDMHLGFEWMGVGDTDTEFPSVYFKVWLVPLDYELEFNASIVRSNEVMQLGRSVYMNNPVFLTEDIVFDASALAGETMRLVFEWTNTTWGVQPPAAIDNVRMSAVHCEAPTNYRIDSVGPNTIDLRWDAVENGALGYELFVTTERAIPTSDTAATFSTADAFYTLDNLSLNRAYFIWIRTNCGSNGKSHWIKVNATTSQVPVDLDYSEDFEGSTNWTISGVGENQWVIGNGVHNGGTKSLYVSKDANVHEYNTRSESITHAYKDFTVDTLTGEISIQFDWMAMGESFFDTNNDYLNVWLVSNTYTPVDGLAIRDTDHQGYRILQEVTGVDAFQQVSFVTRLSALNERFNSRNFRIVLEWINNNAGGTQPPAAIDNLEIKRVLCPRAYDLETEVLEDGSGVLLAWTPGGSEQKWEVIVMPLEDATVPDANTQGIIVDTPSYIFTEEIDPDEEETGERFYKFYVRPICSEDDKGMWSDLSVISFIPPPGCASVEIGFDSDSENVSKDVAGNYIICQNGTVNMTLEASYYDILKTDTYEVEEIEYNPPFPFVGGDAVELVVDDEWSDVIDLGFDFCFFGGKYQKVLINTNGTITFSVKGEVEGGRYKPNGSAPYNPVETVPSDQGFSTGDGPTVNSIFGVMQDLHPGDENSPAERSINYQIMGKAPCRTLVFNMYHMGLFRCNYDPADIEGSTQTSQIVLYEGTNIIEVYVKNRPVCETAFDGRGLIGIQNADGTVGYAPENRNTGNWTAQNEAWRFTPSGESTAVFAWEKNGEFYASTTTIDVAITESVDYKATVRYEICGGEVQLSEEFNFIKEDFEIGTVADIEVCNVREGELHAFDLRTNDDGALGNLNAAEHKIEYFGSLEDANLGVNALPDTYKRIGGGVAFVKLTNLKTNCFQVAAFNLIVREPLKVSEVENVIICGQFEFPILKEGESYYTKPYGEGVKFEGGDVLKEVGVHEFFVYKEIEGGCFGASYFNVEIIETPIADVIEDQVLECETFFLPNVSEHNRYFTEPDGEGRELYVGEEIRYPMTVYIYAKVVGSDGTVCVDESSFRVDYNDCPLPKGISPNGDGYNDTFDLSGYGVLSLQIFNRHGIEVFTYVGVDYTNEWRGQDKQGNLLPDGTYYYVVNTNGKLRTGWVQVNK